MQQIQEEYVRVTETSQQQGASQTKDVEKGTAALPPNMIPPTPQQGELSHIPESIKIVMEELSKAPIGDGQEVKEITGQNTKDKGVAKVDSDGGTASVSVP